MSIDVNEWGKKFHLMRSQHPSFATLTEFADCVQFHVDLCRAVIADEAAKAAPEQPAERKAKCERLRVTVRVGRPEWKCLILPSGAVVMKLGDEWWFYETRDRWHACSWNESEFEPEDTRRVAEATAGKDRRIGELEAERARAENWKANYISESEQRQKLLADIDTLKQQLAAARAEVKQLKAGYIGDDVVFIKLRDENARLTKEREQLADEMVKNNDDGYEDLAEIDRLREEVARLAKWKEDHREMSELLLGIETRHNALEADRDRFKAEVARLSRPVEDVDWCELLYQIDYDPLSWKPAIRKHVEPLLQAERNARVAAEAERDELREFSRTRVIQERKDGTNNSFFECNKRGANVSDEQLNELLAAFRAEKGKVVT